MLLGREPAACDGQHKSSLETVRCWESSLDVPMTPLGHGKPWTRGDSDSMEESI